MLLIGATWTCIETCFLLCLSRSNSGERSGPFGTDLLTWKAGYSFGKLFPALARLGKKNETTEGCSSGFGSKLTQGRNTWRDIKPYLLILLYEDRVLNFNTPHPNSFKTLQHYRAARERKAPWDPSPVGSGHPASMTGATAIASTCVKKEPVPRECLIFDPGTHSSKLLERVSPKMRLQKRSLKGCGKGQVSSPERQSQTWHSCCSVQAEDPKTWPAKGCLPISFCGLVRDLFLTSSLPPPGRKSPHLNSTDNKSKWIRPQNLSEFQGTSNPHPSPSALTPRESMEEMAGRGFIPASTGAKPSRPVSRATTRTIKISNFLTF